MQKRTSETKRSGVHPAMTPLVSLSDKISMLKSQQQYEYHTRGSKEVP
jgi:hypothetical protein